MNPPDWKSSVWPSGSLRTSSLMKVATLSLETTSHSMRFTPKTSGGTSTFMSCLTVTWQERRSPSFSSRRVMCSFSAGRIAPPPSWILTRHWAQLPPPPQAEETKRPLSASTFSSLPPAGATTSRSPLTSMLTSPVATSLERAARMTATRARTTPVNMLTPPRTLSIMRSSASYSWMPEKAMKAMAMRPTVMKVMPRPRRPGGMSA